jgi:hypothetical protein
MDVALPKDNFLKIKMEVYTCPISILVRVGAMIQIPF